MSLPVSIPKVHGGLSSAAGSLYLTDDYLVLQVQVTMLGAYKRKPTTVKIAPQALHSARYKRGLVKDILYLRPWKTGLLAAVPGSHDGEVALRVKRAYRDEAEILVEEIGYWLQRSEQRH